MGCLLSSSSEAPVRRNLIQNTSQGCYERFSRSLWFRIASVTIQIKATEQYFPVVLFIMLYKVVLTFESVNEILKCDHSNESY